MLSTLRSVFNRLKWALIAIVGAVIVGFVFIDTGMGGAGAAIGDERAYAARVNGETITFRDFDRALYYTEQNYRQMYGDQFTPEMIQSLGLGQQVLDSLIDQRLLIQEARRLNLEATPEEVRDRILQIPVLNPDGKFVGSELYTRYVTGQLGYQTPAEFEDELARDITTAKMESALQSSIIVSPKAAEAEYRRMNESAKIRYVLYPSSRELANVTVTPAEVDAYYKANQAQYAHGEQRAMKYLIADFARLRSQIQPTDADLRRTYETAKEQYRSGEAARIQHILIKVDPTAAPEVDAAARARAESLVAQLRGGADFAALARQHSADPSSASAGGDMGWVERGQTVAPFDQAAFSIPLNQISDPIRSQEFGYHIIRVSERRPPQYRTFEEVKPSLVAQVTDEMAKDQARQEVNRIMSIIRQKKPATPDEFAALANDKISSNDTQWFQRSEPIPGIGNNAQLSTWVFSSKQGDIGDPIGTSRGIVIPYLSGVRPTGIAPLAEIRPRVEADARSAKARGIALNALKTAASGAQDIDAVAAKVGLSPAETTVTRQGQIGGFTGDIQELVKAAMSANQGQMGGPVTVADGAVVFQVTEQTRVTPEEIKERSTQYMDALRMQQARSLRTVLLERLRKGAEIDINEQAMQSASGQPAA
ncbi:MAG TPA: peptidyl-prolyl cis-trans isomerase [Thermoanaerobaculia bacterium]|nr:peptidyl-prolyl cis-trans isomerase [Thermoanaerobaculia bacterium]